MGTLDPILRFFDDQGWQPWPFQLEAWRAFLDGRDGLIQVPTGAGKTYAAYMGPLAGLIESHAVSPQRGLRILYITPLRAVSRDIALALERPCTHLKLPFRVECRTGDTSSAVRARQKKEPPQILVTTPESLSILVSQENAEEIFGGGGGGGGGGGLSAVILDEWHELMGSKRGTQAELAMARIRAIAPKARTWALSATIANARMAMACATGVPAEESRKPATLVTADIPRPVLIDSILPDAEQRLPWTGHLGLKMLPRVIERLDPKRSTIVFTNTRSQAELWHRAILAVRPEWEPHTALHHGSLDHEDRELVEAGLKSGAIRLVVATSSLDLGVDFAPVERVVQIGSPKGVARLVQRAGRASHRPGTPCEIVCVPTNTLELLEIDAARSAIASGMLEPRTPPSKPLDVLAQHLVTRAMGGGFEPDELFEEVRRAYSYRELTREEFEWTLALVRDGGRALAAYDRYRKVSLDAQARYRVPDPIHAKLHRFNIGTIVGDATIEVRFRSGKRLGNIEEGFVALLRAGERFVFAGRVLRFLGLRDLSCIVEPAVGGTTLTPHWAGTKLPITETLGEHVRRSLHRAAVSPDSPELRAAGEIIRTQAELSIVPGPDEILAESCRTTEGSHLFLYPFAGRLVHAGLASLLALRITRTLKTTFAISVNDYGLELLSADREAHGIELTPELFATDNLAAEALESVNVAELGKIQFREVARIAGLVFQNYPGTRKTGKQSQASASLLYDVFAEFDPGNLLLEQARREVLERQFEGGRLARTLDRLAAAAREGRLRHTTPARPTPLAYPLIVERVSGRLSGETLVDRLAKMRAAWDSQTSNSARGTASEPVARIRRKPSGRKSSL